MGIRKPGKRVTFLLLAAVVVIALVGVFSLSAGQQAAAQTERAGEVVLVQGQVLDTDGKPIPGAVVELWQTDANGRYNHPGSATGAALVKDFQYFGTATADEDGYYAFRTIKPSEYGSRPPHLHIKVRIDGREVLTTQFYFEEDLDMIQADRVAGSAASSLILTTVDSEDEDGNALRIATGDLVIDRNGNAANKVTATPRQAEGPFYPVVDFSDYDNNLTDPATDEEPVKPVLSPESGS